MYGDTKPQNALVGTDGIYLMDLEQSVENGDAAWDIAEFLYYSATPLEREKGDANTVRLEMDEFAAEERVAIIARAFLDSYEEENGREAIVMAHNYRYVSPFLPLLEPSMIEAIRKVLSEYSSE